MQLYMPNDTVWILCVVNMFMTQTDDRMFSKVKNAGPILFPSNLKLGGLKDSSAGSESTRNAHRIGTRWRTGLPSICDKAAQKIIS
jgi:hypothetical protein